MNGRSSSKYNPEFKEKDRYLKGILMMEAFARIHSVFSGTHPALSSSLADIRLG